MRMQISLLAMLIALSIRPPIEAQTTLIQPSNVSAVSNTVSQLQPYAVTASSPTGYVPRSINCCVEPVTVQCRPSDCAGETWHNSGSHFAQYCRYTPRSWQPCVAYSRVYSFSGNRYPVSKPAIVHDAPVCGSPGYYATSCYRPCSAIPRRGYHSYPATYSYHRPWYTYSAGYYLYRPWYAKTPRYSPWNHSYSVYPYSSWTYPYYSRSYWPGHSYSRYWYRPYHGFHFGFRF